MLHPCLTTPFQYMSTWFQNDDLTSFETANGMPLWSFGAQDSKFSSLFDEGMASDARLVLSVVIDKCKDVFDGIKTLVDVGGGTGTMAKGIANAFPHLECTVIDLPQVVDGLEGTKNLKFLAGDMFEAIPPANAILLKWIFHDWSDEDCVKILEQCKKAIKSSGGEGGKVIIIEIMLENKKMNDHDSIETQLFFDMLMLTVVQGRERSEKDWAKIFSSAGFRGYKITPIMGLRSLIEVFP